MSEKLRRVSRRNPCPICGRPDWCSVSADGHLCICMRISEGSVKQSSNGGFVHVLRDDPERRVRQRACTAYVDLAKPKPTDMVGLAERCRQAVNHVELRRLAELLGLAVQSLRRLHIGWDVYRGAWTFSMRDHLGRVRGIRLRFPDGRKKAIYGGHEGLFIPDGLAYSAPLLMAEGPTDTAALLDLGFEAVGRPSCTGGVALCVELVRAHWPLDVVVVSDADTCGQRGADSLAVALLPYAHVVRVIQPPNGIKDARAWKMAGATAADVQATINGAAIRHMEIRSRREAVRGR